MIGAEKVALTTPWAGYRWGPVVAPGREMFGAADADPRPVGGRGPAADRADRRAPVAARRGRARSSPRSARFHAGDRLRRINWRVSLRQGTLHVESTRAEEDTAVLLIVDALADYGASEGRRRRREQPRRHRPGGGRARRAVPPRWRPGLAPGAQPRRRVRRLRHRHPPPAPHPDPALADPPGRPARRRDRPDRLPGHRRHRRGRAQPDALGGAGQRDRPARPARAAGDRGRPAAAGRDARRCGPTATRTIARWPGGCGCSTASHLLASLAAVGLPGGAVARPADPRGGAAPAGPPRRSCPGSVA